MTCSLLPADELLGYERAVALVLVGLYNIARLSGHGAGFTILHSRL